MGFLDRFRQRQDDHSTDPGSTEPGSTDPGSSEPGSTEPMGAGVAGGLMAAVDPASRADQLEELEESAREMVSPAFEPRGRVEEVLVEQFVLDDAYDLTEDDVREALQRVWSDRLERETTWADEGDYRRLKAAFEVLESGGIVARMNFACCQGCGHVEIEDERVDGSRGYVFFDEQDAQRLTPGGSDLFLAFGGLDFAAGPDALPDGMPQVGDQEAKRAAVVRAEELIGAEVAGALRREGLVVEWDGTSSQRIQVTGLDWRKRLPVG